MNFLKSFSLYTFASIVERAVSFFILPVFTYYLSTKDFGILSLHSTISTFMLPLISLGIQGSISIAYYKKEKKEYSNYFSSSIFFPFILSLLISINILFFKSFIEFFFGIPIIWILLIPIFSFFSFVNSLLLIDYQIKNEPKKYVIFSLSNSIFNILISVLFVVLFDYGFEGRIIGQYVSIFIFFILSIYILHTIRKELRIKFNLNDALDSLKFGIPLIPHIIGGMVMNMSDRFFIDYFYGKSELGIYNIGYLVGSSISLFSAAFANAIIPFSYHLFNQNTYHSKVKVVRIYWFYSIFLIFTVFILWILNPYIFKWFINSKFSKGSEYVFWVTLAYFFQGLYLLFANILFYLKKTKIFFFLSFINISLNVLLNYYLIIYFGIIGAAYATLISFLLFFIMISYYTNKIYPMPWLFFLKKYK